MLKGYRLLISPLLPASCRFVPTCSEYAETCVKRFGTIKGGQLAVQRVLKCHPWGSAGLDPVPSRPEKE